MRHAVLRALAIVVLLGQVVQVAGGALCGRQHRPQGAHCDTGMTSAGTTVGTQSNAGDAACFLLGPCGTPVPALTAPPAIAAVVIVGGRTPAGSSAFLSSFDAAPIPPPPQG